MAEFHGFRCGSLREREDFVRGRCLGESFSACNEFRRCRFVGRFTIVCVHTRFRRHFPEEIEAGAGGTSQGMDVTTVLAGLGVAAAGVALAVRRRVRAAAVTGHGEQ